MHPTSMAAKATSRPLVWQLSFVAIILTLFFLILRDKSNEPHRTLVGGDSAGQQICSLSASVAEQLDLTAPISYARLHIDVKDTKWYHRRGNDSAAKELGVAIPSPRQLSEEDGALVAAEHETCSNRTALTIPAQSKTPADASNIVFGVATTIERLDASLSAFSHWAGHTGAKIFALVEHEDVSAGHIAVILRDAADLGIDLEIARQSLSQGASDGDRYFALTKHLYEHQPQSKHAWAAFIDDDTFFLSMQALLQQLEQYDAAEPQYVGGLAEDLRQLLNFGYMAYGGGGVFVSMPLLAQVYEHFDECDATQFEGGDRRLAACIYEHTTTKLSWVPGLHQTDLHGDPSGFYEADREQPLSVHHWKSWNEVDVVGLSAVASICEPACLLQRYRFSDGWFLVNGFSIFKYSEHYEADDIVMEETWWDAGDYGHSLAPLHPKDNGKVSYRLEGDVVEEGLVRQYYVQRQDSGDGVVEVVWQRRS